LTDSEKPLVTFALFAYNQEEYIREAVEGALSQSYSPLEIILSDDSSTDATFTIMAEMVADYSGPHSVSVRRNDVNLGLAGHVNKINEIAGGELIVAAAGDDISYSYRVTKLVDQWLITGKRECSIFSAMDEIDFKSQKTGKIYRSTVAWNKVKPSHMIESNMGVYGAAHAWSVRVPRFFPAMFSEVINEDAVIPFRATLLGGITYIDEVLVAYRANIGLASNYGDGVMPARRMARQVALLHRPYVVSVQRIADLKFVGGVYMHLIALAKSRRADYLFRYWLAAGRTWTLKRIIYFGRRSRFAWIVRELWLHFEAGIRGEK